LKDAIFAVQVAEKDPQTAPGVKEDALRLVELLRKRLAGE
jgi:hypothetical protein